MVKTLKSAAAIVAALAVGLVWMSTGTSGQGGSMPSTKPVYGVRLKVGASGQLGAASFPSIFAFHNCRTDIRAIS